MKDSRQQEVSPSQCQSGPGLRLMYDGRRTPLARLPLSCGDKIPSLSQRLPPSLPSPPPRLGISSTQPHEKDRFFANFSPPLHARYHAALWKHYNTYTDALTPPSVALLPSSPNLPPPASLPLTLSSPVSDANSDRRDGRYGSIRAANRSTPCLQAYGPGQ